MKVEVNDIVVVEVTRSEKSSVRHIVKVQVVSQNAFTGKSLAKGTTAISVELSKVMANLGPDPKMGWVYGYHISGGLEGITKIGDTDVVLKVIPPDGMLEAMTACMKRFPAVFNLLKFRIEVHGPRKNKLGFWSTYKKTDTDTMGIHTLAFTMDEIEDTMIHETGHGVWNRLMDEKLRARFIEAYTRSVDIHAVPLAVIMKRAADFDSQGGSVYTYMKGLDKGDKQLFAKMITWIKEVHHITREDINRLRSGDFKVASYFPTHALVSSTVLPVITQYATTKPVEFFCEAWAHYWLRKPMPSAVVKIMDDLCQTLNIKPRVR